MGSSRCARCTGPRADRAQNACNDRPDCVALLIPDPLYENGHNEGIVKRLAQPGKVNQTLGIQIVYDDKIEAAVLKAEEEDKPLMIYSWLPRAEIMTKGRFVRVTLESFYHCSGADAELQTQEKPVARQHGQCAVSAVPQPGLLGRTPAPGCASHSRGALQPLGHPWQRMVLPAACAKVADIGLSASTI